jgi:hypothetical protein
MLKRPPATRCCREASWSVYDDSLPEKGRGNVRWRTLIEQMLSRGGREFIKSRAS